MRHTSFITGLLSSLLLLQPVLCADQAVTYVKAVDADGDTILLADDRQPALYTGDFGDCLGGRSQVQLTEFRAAYYKDNSTILFQFAGNNTLHNTTLMLSIDVYAYGQNRFHKIFDPCGSDLQSLCPARSNKSIWAEYIIPVGAKDVASIPDIALAIPDFEGQAILRLYSNETESEVGCYAAIMTNGNSMSQPATVGTVLGLFTLVAVIASFTTTIYGQSVTDVRTHYAHSFSGGVVFAVFQHIFLTGAISVNWPSVLPAFWSNFAWSAGMIHTASMQASINSLIGSKVGNVSLVGGAGAGTSQPALGGGYNLHSIYKRDTSALIPSDFEGVKMYSREVTNALSDAASLPRLSLRNVANSTSSTTSSSTTVVAAAWSGTPVASGMPVPGNFSGFAGTLVPEHIRASNAFLTALLWLILLFVLVIGTLVLLKWTMEALIRLKAVRNDRLVMFRNNWIEYLLVTTLRLMFLAFPLIMFITLWDFSYQQSIPSKVIAAIVFVVFLFSACSVIAYAYWYRMRSIQQGRSQSSSSASSQHEKMAPSKLERATESLQSLITRTPNSKLSSNKMVALFIKLAEAGQFPSSIHDDEEYTRKFGWMVSRLRRSRWWFFGALTFYEFLRACLLGGGSASPIAQIFGLVVVEILAFAMLIWVRPFEGRRLNIFVTYFLGVSKIACPALSLAFYAGFNLPRILTTVIGIIIILVQAALTLVTLVAIVAGAITSWMSIRRHVPTEQFKPVRWRTRREKYFVHINRAAQELPRLPKAKAVGPPPSSPKPSGPYFNVSSMRRMEKIEDGDKGYQVGISVNPNASVLSLPSRCVTPVGRPMSPNGLSFDPALRSERTTSIGSSITTSNLPFGAKQIRPSWSVQNFHEDKRSIHMVDIPSHNIDDGSLRSPTLLPSPLSEVHQPRSPSFSLTPQTSSLRHVRSMDTVRSQPASTLSPGVAVSDIPMPRIRPRSSMNSLRAPSRTASPMGYSDNSGLMSPVSIDGLVSPQGSYFPGRSASAMSGRSDAGSSRVVSPMDIAAPLLKPAPKSRQALKVVGKEEERLSRIGVAQ